VEIALRYEGYIRRDRERLERAGVLERVRIPESMPYEMIPSLRTEARQKLELARPSTLGQASRISGVSPADIASLSVWLARADRLRETPNGPVDISFNHSGGSERGRREHSDES
jgi:tRNA uridine 5-carboxymethylaminomethyl modification enzyme